MSYSWSLAHFLRNDIIWEQLEIVIQLSKLKIISKLEFVQRTVEDLFVLKRFPGPILKAENLSPRK